MKVADLYIRVSTDEQADKGYSQRNQDEQLKKYCRINDIKVGKVIFEDHSAKNFNRPEWKKLLVALRKEKGGQTDFILFTKWDRFSRNAGDAYQMINVLRKLGIEPQAVEQPLDLSIPENKMMLAFYLAAPEVENDRRALNTFFGMRRAKKEGRWMATAPLGYENRVSPDGRKYIAPKHPESDIIKWGFEQLATGIYSVAQIWRMAKQKGLKSAKNGFWIAMRNPAYCGKIFIPKYKDEEACFVPGQHEPIISEATFYEAQDVLNGRKKVNLVKVTSLDELPLRGFLKCPRCGRNLSGSPSKGKTQWYFYYHCQSSCGYRMNAQVVNEEFIEHLKYFSPEPAMTEVYAEVVDFHYHLKMKDGGLYKKQWLSEIEEVNKHLTRARGMLVNEDIDPRDYRLIKAECEEKINRLEKELDKIAAKEVDSLALFKKLVNTLINVDLFYLEGTTEEKRQIIGTIYPQKLEIEKGVYRTPKVNEGADFIYQINSELWDKKNGTEMDFSNLSRIVTPERFELSTQ
ncbi:recombinase family protein [Mucilaginibacter sp. cycad4]|uniref:recombinase family protein n=1 Tax=Mucilaginibacter sp. cycad4 TaxID=3342096 RepID=UPI002AAAB624|nr:recombinase family protein [Mucilaginibacter gossypii]WPV01913.1 recombinase family protein [Mucilaginibacter gossypii]